MESVQIDRKTGQGVGSARVKEVRGLFTKGRYPDKTDEKTAWDMAFDRMCEQVEQGLKRDRVA